jgi:hypothetical protein
MNMKPGARKWLCLAGSAAMTTAVGTAQAAALDRPYEAIAGKNVFHLHDAPELANPPPTNAPLPKVYLMGISTILGMKQAYFVVQLPPVPGKPAPADKYFTLSEGRKQEMLEVLAIDPKAKLVKINNSGAISTITFEANKIAFNTAPGGPPGGNAPNPGGGINLNVADPNNHQPAAHLTGRAPQLDAEQQVVLMELQREATKSQVTAGQMPPLPPTPLSNIIQQEQQQQQNGGAPVIIQPAFPGQHNTLK